MTISPAISMYQASIPRFVTILGNLMNILDKAQADQESLMRLMTTTSKRAGSPS